MKVLVINAGSSSMKFTLFSMQNEKVMAKGLVERVGSDKPNMIYKREDGYVFEGEIPVKNHVDSLKEIVRMLTDSEVGVVKDLSEIVACGHRVVVGGEKITEPMKINNEVKDIIREYFPLAPLHNPANLSGIEACEEAMPTIPNVAVFDTQFHQTMQPEAYLYAIPYEYYKEYGIRKYGFHGTSHHYVMKATAKFLGKSEESTTLITCHLGNGCSIAAIQDGKVVDTSMGMTPLEGLMMGTRSGDIDPAAVIRLIDLGKTTAEVDKILNKQSGLFGIGGINSGDMRDMLESAASGNDKAQLAVDMFVRRIVKYIGSYFVLLNNLDGIVFTGGIGEYSCPIRKMVTSKLASLGIKIDDDKNKECFGKSGIISTEDSSYKCLVMPTNEELMIARSVVDKLNLKK